MTTRAGSRWTEIQCGRRRRAGSACVQREFRASGRLLTWGLLADVPGSLSRRAAEAEFLGEGDDLRQLRTQPLEALRSERPANLRLRLFPSRIGRLDHPLP